MMAGKLKARPGFGQGNKFQDEFIALPKILMGFQFSRCHRYKLL
jgi:hypothetical protein